MDTQTKITPSITSTIFLRSFFTELGSAVLYFPIIYYSVGLEQVAKRIKFQIIWLERLFAIRLSLHTLFTPLYGDYTRSGRFVGFFIRVFLLIFRIMGFMFTVFLFGLLFALYLLAPFIILYLIFSDAGKYFQYLFG